MVSRRGAACVSLYCVHATQISLNHGRMIRCGIRVREKLAYEFERRTGMFRAHRRQLVATVYLAEISRLIARRDLARAKASSLVLQEAFAAEAGFGLHSIPGVLFARSLEAVRGLRRHGLATSYLRRDVTFLGT